ncbi:MAG: polysaccharide deacetylase family protein [Candidatus Krumholzibacteriota bacterium]|nr:polysaccharide deacetylase family protein [Candidatus Krumholzibacteriota bacterium]
MSAGKMKVSPAIILAAMLFAACGLEDSPSLLRGADISQPLPSAAQWYLTTRAEYTPRIECLKHMADTLAMYGILVEPPPGMPWRFGSRPWMATASINQSGYLKDRPPLDIGAEPETLLTHMGLAEDSLDIEVLGAKDWLEDLTGECCRCFAWPYHKHDRGAMNLAADGGFIAARNGTASYEPWGSFLNGYYTNPVWLDSWDHCALWELNLQILCQDIQALPLDSIAMWLQAPERLPCFKDHNTWIHLYTHTDDPAATGTPILDAEHLAALVDALIADGDVWIAPVGEVAEYVRATHAPDPAEPLVWIPAGPTSVPEWPREQRDEPARPWHGRACAFSFSTDDGFRANLTAYAPVFHERELSFTAFLNPRKIQDSDAGTTNYMCSAEVLQFQALGMEVGCHGMEHRYCLPHEACCLTSLREEGDPSVEIATEGSMKVLRLQFPDSDRERPDRREVPHG